jgi:peptidase E
MAAKSQIVGLGGYPAPGDGRNLWEWIASLTGKPKPKILFVPTAVGDQQEYVKWFEESHAGLGDLATLTFFPFPPADLREFVLGHDAIHICGGNTANALAIWRVHGFDAILREAWEQGTVLYGGSAGMICWFEASITDSFGPQLEGMRDGLGILPGSACPHYDVEPLRRPRYRELIAAGFPGGIAVDDCVAVHYIGTELHEVVAFREGAGACLVSGSGEVSLPVRIG